MSMRCDYCNSNYLVDKIKYKGKTSQGKRKSITIKLCGTCQAFGVANSQEKVYELCGETVIPDTIKSLDGSEMYAY